MRIGLNATCFNDRPSGARQRFEGIYGALVRRCPQHEFIVYEPRDCAVGGWFGDAPNVTVRRTPLPSVGRIRRTFGGMAYWPAVLAQDRLDLFEAFHLPLVRAPRCPTVLTIHDARPVLREVPWLKRMFFGRVLRSAMAGADHIITVSDTMRQEIVGLGARGPVTRIYNGIDPGRFAPIDPVSAQEAAAKFGLPTPFLLAVGHLEARKNYPRLLEAVALLHKAGRPMPLVIVGNDGGEGAHVAAEIDRLGLRGHVHLLRGVSDGELARIYALASLVVFPSYYEGFGIPVLEAMAASKPLVLSDIPVFQELTEGRGAYFPAHDAAAMARVIGELLDDPARQQALVAYGKARLTDFAFDALAGQVEDVYRSVRP